MYHSTLGSRVTKKKRSIEASRAGDTCEIEGFFLGRYWKSRGRASAEAGALEVAARRSRTATVEATEDGEEGIENVSTPSVWSTWVQLAFPARPKSRSAPAGSCFRV